MIRSLVLFWGFPNQLSSDIWAVGFEEADHAALWIARRPMGAATGLMCLRSIVLGR